MPVLDHISCIDVSEHDSINELITLDSLSLGLSSLFDQISQLENPIRSHELDSKKEVFFFGFGLFENFGISPHFERLLPCYFHWFGNTLCNFARLVGFLHGISAGAFSRAEGVDSAEHALVRQYCSDYVDSIPELAPVKVWRNKVFAHFAITDPRRDDNAALLDVSAMSPVSYFKGRLRVGGMTVVARGAEVEMPPWSVTEVFEQLGPRFWPAQPLNKPASSA